MDDPARINSVERLRWWAQTHRGKVRKNNEDSFLCLKFDAHEIAYLGKFGEDLTEHMDFVFAVSDGMGGAMAGEFASRVAVDKITRLLPRAYKLSALGLDAGVDDVFEELFDEIHRSLVFLGESDADCAGMGATLSLCWFAPGQMYFAHIGDSRIYFLPARDGGIKQVSQDDTHVGWLFRNAKLSEREARTHPRRNVLQKSLGAGNQFVNPQVGIVRYEKGDQFLLCTDGIVDGLYDAQLEEFLREPIAAEGTDNRAARLVDAALERSGRDNTTAVVIEAL